MLEGTVDCRSSDRIKLIPERVGIMAVGPAKRSTAGSTHLCRSYLSCSHSPPRGGDASSSVLALDLGRTIHTMQMWICPWIGDKYQPRSQPPSPPSFLPGSEALGLCNQQEKPADLTVPGKKSANYIHSSITQFDNPSVRTLSLHDKLIF